MSSSKTTAAPGPVPALRIVHLDGGLRAYDLGEPETRVGPDYKRHHMTFPRQPYAELYGVLRSLGFRPVGVEFFTNSAVPEDIQPPDFEVLSDTLACSTLQAQRAWSDVRHVAGQRSAEVLDLAGRFSTYHRLLTIRVRDLSEAYRRCLLAQLTTPDGRYQVPRPGTLFANGFQTYIEAALHAFLADAAGLRDLIAEATWRLVLKKPQSDVTTLGKFLKRSKDERFRSPLVESIHVAGSDGGWLKRLTDLRNTVTHVAPLANTHELHETQLRMLPLRGGALPIAHYPLTMADGSLRSRPEPIDFDAEDEDVLKARLDEYRQFVEHSRDALAYVTDVLDRLVMLGNVVRTAAGLRSQMRTMTDKDIVGPVTIYGPDGPKTYPPTSPES
jgi:hypothetical protein